jgi:uncharacterized Ntn-hydrolase superfamily protein
LAFPALSKLAKARAFGSTAWHSDSRGVSIVQLNTFSVAARCSRSGMLGVAVATAVPAVGGLVPHVDVAAGAVATQAWVNPYLGIDAITLLGAGRTAQETLDVLIAADHGRDLRQLGIVDRLGGSAAWTGPSCTPHAGHILGPGTAVQGNMLAGPQTLRAMAEALDRSADLSLPERLMLALEAGEAAGGDKRGKQSAALKVVDREAYPCLDLRVDEHPEPVAELRRIFEVAQRQLVPFVAGMPTKADPFGTLGPDVTAMLLLPPEARPGGRRGNC